MIIWSVERIQTQRVYEIKGKTKTRTAALCDVLKRIEPEPVRQ